MVCEPEKLTLVIQAMQDSHPYEVVAYHVVEHFYVDC